MNIFGISKSFASLLGDFEKKEKYLLGILIIIVIASRFPFIDAGYGNDPDAWRLANAAFKIAETNEYVFSREPGHPVQEIVSAIVYKGGPVALNGMTALFSLLATVCFALTLRKWKFKSYFWAGLAFAFTPIVYINSINSMDYIWAIGLIMAGLYLVAINRPILAGIMLGLAIGCRMTSGAMLVPFAILLYYGKSDRDTKSYLKSILILGAITVAVGALVYIPAFLKFGKQLLSFYDVPIPLLKDSMKKASVELWGSFGTVALAVILSGIALIPRYLCTESKDFSNKYGFLVRPAIVAIILFVIGFLRLPCEAAYLIPIVPFVILLLAAGLKRWVFIALCTAMILSPFVDISFSNSTFNVSSGPFVEQYSSRARGSRYVERIFSETANLPHKSVIVAAWWEPQLRLLRNDNVQESHQFVYHLDQNRLNQWLAKGYTIYHLPAVADYNKDNYGVDLDSVSTLLSVQY